MGGAMKISFCTTCKGRAHHLKETLPKNLEDNKGHPQVEFVLLDYNSPDDLSSWVRQNLSIEISNGRVIYYQETTAAFFDPRHAKNIAHLLGTGDVLVNLDADNFTGPGYAGGLADAFVCPNAFVTSVDERKKYGEWFGLSGRIALKRKDFLRLRGYDESQVGWGGEDLDLIRRAQHSGLKRIPLLWPGESVIRHSDSERLRYFKIKAPRTVTNAANLSVSTKHPDRPINSLGYGLGVVYKNFENVPQEVGIRS